LEIHSRSPCNRENAEDAEFLGDTTKSPQVVPGKPTLLRHLSGLLFSPVLEDVENTPASAAADPNSQKASEDDDPEKASAAVRGLFRSPSAPCRVSRAPSGQLIGRRNSQKRGETDHHWQPAAGVEAKRQRSSCDASSFPPTAAETPSAAMQVGWAAAGSSGGGGGCRPLGRGRFHRSHSETEVMIKSALSRAELHPDLIGDFSKPYCLPLISCAKHPDLKSISPHTVRL